MQFAWHRHRCRHRHCGDVQARTHDQSVSCDLHGIVVRGWASWAVCVPARSVGLVSLVAV